RAVFDYGKGMVTPMPPKGSDVTVAQPSNSEQEPRQSTERVSRPVLLEIIRRNTLLVTVCCSISVAVTGGLAGFVWWIFRPPVVQVAVYAGVLAFVLLIASALLVLLNAARPRGRLAVIALVSLLFMLCELVPAGYIY